MHPEQLLYEAVLPAAGAMILALLFRRDWIAPVALTLAFLAGSRFVIGRFPEFPPGSAQTWLFYKAILIGAVALVSTSASAWMKAPVILILTADVLTRVLDFKLRSWSDSQAMLWIGTPSLIAVLWWWTMSKLIERSNDWSSHITAAMLSIACGVLLIMSVAAAYGRMGLALGGGVTALAIAALYLRNPQIITAALPAASVIQIALLCAGRFTATDGDAIPLHAGILLCAPVLAWIGQISAIERLSPWKRFALRIALPIIPMGASLGLAAPAFLENMRGELY